MKRFTCTLFLMVCGLGGGSCASSDTIANLSPEPRSADFPFWLARDIQGGDWCGLGAAGPGYVGSPYPKAKAKQRAIHDLAGAIETAVSEAMVAVQRDQRTMIDSASHLEVAEELLRRVSQEAQVDYWFDGSGWGPFRSEDFVYARACLPVGHPLLRKLSSEFNSEAQQRLRGIPTPEKQPPWVDESDPRNLKAFKCAVGFSQPTFFPDASLVNVIEDVRRQLSLGLETLVSEYQEEHLAGAFTSHEVITVATSEAVSRGARILQYWFDLDGIGPQGTKRSTYGYGCVHTSRLLKSVTDILGSKNQGEN